MCLECSESQEKSECLECSGCVDASFGTALISAVQADPSLEVTVDVERLVIEAHAAGLTTSFPLDPAVQERLVGGLDDITLTLRHAPALEDYESTRAPWLPVSTILDG